MVAKRHHMKRTATDESLDTFLATALGHPLRIALLRAIYTQQDGLARQDIANLIPSYSAETVARHLRLLSDMGLITSLNIQDLDGKTSAESSTYRQGYSVRAKMIRSMLDASDEQGSVDHSKTSDPRREQQEQTWQQMRLLKEVIAAVPEAVALVGADGQFLLVNEVAEKLWGQAVPQNIQTGEYNTAFKTYSPHGELLPAQNMVIPSALSGKTVVGKQIIYERPDGTQLDLLCNAAPIYDDTPEGAQIIGAVCTFQDITHLKTLERQRDEFLSIAAHELRTPLTSILGTVQVLLRQLARTTEKNPLDLAGLKRGLARVNVQSQRINKLVSDLLDTSRIQAGRLEFTMEAVDLVAIVHEAVDGQRVAHPERTITVTAPDDPIPVLGDAVRLGQVFDNLLTNALKYSLEDAPVEVTVQTIGQEACASARDYGGGIPLEAIPHLFERFYRVPGVEVQSDSGIGLGLGLYITHTIVSRHHGRIKVTSEPGNGTTFHVCLPLEETASKQA